MGLRELLRRTELEPEDLYRSNRTYTTLLHRAGPGEGPAPESSFTRALARLLRLLRLLHVDDEARLGRWGAWLEADEPLGGEQADPEDPLQLMLFAALGQVRRPVSEMGAAFGELWEMDDLRRELVELLEVLDDRRRRPTWPLADLPFAVHATYSRDEISAGLGQVGKGKLMRTQAGVLEHDRSRSDVLYVTLEKDEKDFTPTTLYNDYPISPTRFHWESQTATRADSPTGRRYQEHASRGWRILLFVRQARRDERGETMPYLFLGPVRYVEHEGEREMPAEFFQRVKVAAG